MKKKNQPYLDAKNRGDPVYVYVSLYIFKNQ